MANIWQIHPFRKGNTRTIIVFTVLLAKSMGYEVNHHLFREHAYYLRNALVWALQGMYSKYEYIERIFFDAILHMNINELEKESTSNSKYEKICI